jgi:hypothetical protein
VPHRFNFLSARTFGYSLAVGWQHDDRVVVSVVVFVLAAVAAANVTTCAWCGTRTNRQGEPG